MKCAYCHDQLDVAAICVECQTALHFECWEELPDCPTLGCEVEVLRGPWGIVTSILGFLFVCIAATNYKVNPVYGPIYWECNFLQGYEPSVPEDVKVQASRVDEFQLHLNSVARSLRGTLDRSPRQTDSTEPIEITQCRRRVVGRKKEIPWDVDPSLLPFQNMG